VITITSIILESSSKFLPTMSKVEKQLSSILPPREIVENGELFIQKVSPEPASRTTIIEKSELLDKKLQEAQVNLVNLDSWTERFILGT